MLCQFLLYNDVDQLYVYIYPLPLESPSQPLHPPHLGHHRAELPVLYCFFCCYFLTTHSEQTYHICQSPNLNFPSTYFFTYPMPSTVIYSPGLGRRSGWPHLSACWIWSRISQTLFHSPVFSQSLVQHVQYNNYTVTQWSIMCISQHFHLCFLIMIHQLRKGGGKPVSLKRIEAQLWGGSPHKSDLRTGILGINSPQPSPTPPK